ncbi:2TM domain-containing protein [Lutibacter citreus]|uniref:2TM domain-containing protein n=1 Tax=Lutibacter citreus TaxID=2138210 RepID=UPI000DBE0524|nr:2TM domain-containing protein [Lutibacter citreus]
MNTNFTEEQKYIKAKKKVDEIKSFYWNLFSYCVVIPFLIFINLMTSPDHYWFWWPMFGWGIGLLFHGFGVFGKNVIFDKNWENKKIREIMDKESNNKF